MKIQKKAALTACSDPLPSKQVEELCVLKERLCGEGIEAEIIGGFFDGEDPDPVRKGQLLTDCFRDQELDYIFDVSGGDLANFVLPHLDFDVIKNSRAVFFGYSDLSTVINAIIKKTGRWAVNYQIRNILYDHAREQLHYLHESILKDHIVPEDLKIEFLRGESMEGQILGGNIRCFLKLAGTVYWPRMKDSILLLEAHSSGEYKIMTALEQYRQMGIFDQIKGVLLGTFTRMEQEHLTPRIHEHILRMVPEHVPVAKTRYIGHFTDARAVVLGRHCRINDPVRFYAG